MNYAEYGIGLFIVLLLSGVFTLFCGIHLLLDITGSTWRERIIHLGVLILGILMLLVGTFIMTKTFEAEVKLQAKQTQEVQTQEIAAVKEYETKGQIGADRAWWINLPAEKLEEKCRAIASKVGQTWQELVNLLSGNNATVMFNHQPLTP